MLDEFKHSSYYHNYNTRHRDLLRLPLARHLNISLLSDTTELKLGIRLQNRTKDTLERVIILTLNENKLKQQQEFTLAASVETFVLDHWTLSKRSSLCLVLKSDQSQNDFWQRQVLIPDSVIDSDWHTLSLPPDNVS